MHTMVLLLPSTSTSTSVSFRRLLPTVGRCSTGATAIVVHRHHRHHRRRYHDAGDNNYPPSPPPPPPRHSARSFVTATPPPLPSPSASASAGPSSGGEVVGASAAPAPDVVATTRATTTTATTIGRPRVVILGTGWAGFTLARKLDKSRYDVRVVSPANHFLFTPLLPSTAVGTLEFRAIQEPVRTIDGLDKYYQAKATDIDIGGRSVKCEDLYSGAKFEVPYDYLCVAGGMKSNTFHVQK
jgi:hypothetical protein